MDTIQCQQFIASRWVIHWTHLQRPITSQFHLGWTEVSAGQTQRGIRQHSGPREDEFINTYGKAQYETFCKQHRVLGAWINEEANQVIGTVGRTKS